MDKYEEAATAAAALHDLHQEVMEMFRKIVAGCATTADGQRYLAAWERATESGWMQGAY